MKRERVAEVLDAAHDVLLVNGWQQGAHGRHGGPVCAMGAITSATMRVTGRDDCDDLVLCEDADEALRDFIGRPIVRWNDDPERTLDEVLDAFRHAAKRLREQA